MEDFVGMAPNALSETRKGTFSFLGGRERGETVFLRKRSASKGLFHALGLILCDHGEDSYLHEQNAREGTRL